LIVTFGPPLAAAAACDPAAGAFTGFTACAKPIPSSEATTGAASAPCAALFKKSLRFTFNSSFFVVGKGQDKHPFVIGESGQST
jgi:hypothetical protein